MNTHSNERPYACVFPGCPRTFGVRSNAKRHLRTHGIFPNPPDPGPVEAPYVVGFSTPMILQPHQRDIRQHDGAIRGEGSSSAQPGSEDTESTQSLGQEKREHSSLKIPPYRVRWMPPSLTIRTNVPSLRKVQDGPQEFPDDNTQPRRSRNGKQRRTSDEMDKDDYNEGEYNSQTAKEVDDDDMDDESREARIFGDAAVASRLNIPFPPVMSSSGSLWSGAVESSQSESGLSRAVSSPVSRSQSSSLYSVPFSPSHSATSSKLPQSASMSPVNQPGEYASRWAPNFPNLDQGETADFEERNSYLPTGSRPNTPSQNRDKKAR
ncbi:hypothetical protein GALMADRAFT_1172209 [Galerina marginata CBS 339.88]|uniref:C2H2-type domain-containing protein n=1 Tax=Galerina marginata (strain CBS 339.88) TaxID=685588 RepID=A0A067TM12_GALM3|nr:hypothetical protein GALMADRAFT_1172209 [Galerina marginata CBS 339.88]